MQTTNFTRTFNKEIPPPPQSSLTNHKKHTANTKHALYIIIPIYNVAPYLKECLNSIQTQTYSHFKAIMIDDCSSDDSAQIAKIYAKNDKRFILLQTPTNQGIGMTRNVGLDYIFTMLKPSKDDYIGFVDSDDVIAIDYYENLIYCLESNAKRNIMVAKSFNVYRFKHEHYKKAIFAYRRRKSRGGITKKGSKIAAWLTLYRAPFLRDLRYPNVRLGEDITFGNITNALSPQVAYTRKARYFYRQREGSLMKRWQYSYDENFINFAYMLEHFAKFNLLKTHKIDISLVANMPSGTENKHFKNLQDLVRKYHFEKAILDFNPHLRFIVESKDYTEFLAKLKMPLKKRIKQYFRIDIRTRRIFIKLFGKVLIDKTMR